MIKRISFLTACLSVVLLTACGASSSSSASSNSGNQPTTTTTALAAAPTTQASSSSSGGSCDNFALTGGKAGAKVTQIGVTDGATCSDVKAVAAASAVLQKAMDFSADGYTCSGIPDPDTGDIDYNCSNANKGLLFNAIGVS